MQMNSQKQPRRSPPGIRVRHARSCKGADGGTCRCTPSYEAWVFDPRALQHARECPATAAGGACVCTPTRGVKIRKSFPTLSAARGWRGDATSALRKGTMRAPTSTTLREAADVFIAGARDGTILARTGVRYRPSAVRGYDRALKLRILPELGARKLSDVNRFDLQDLVDRLHAEGLSASTLQNTLMPLRAIYRRALRRGDVAVNPTSSLDMPASTGRRDRIASPVEAEKLVAALVDVDRALWATAVYGGLRRGELMALRWEDVDFEAGWVRVERAYDPKAGAFLEPKTAAGRRRVPLPTVLRAHLREHQLRTGRRIGLVFSGDGRTPFDGDWAHRRARAAWKAAGLDPIGLHECRHTFASLMIAAGVNAKALSTYIGHASVTLTLDRYGHLMPGNETEAAGLLDAYLTLATGARTGAQPG